MSYHVEALRFGFKELPDRILVREDGAYGDHKAHGTPIIDYWYVLEQRVPPTEREIISARLEQLEVDNAKLRELCKKLYRLADESYVPFKDVNPWMNEFDNAIRAMRELGIEVD